MHIGAQGHKQAVEALAKEYMDITRSATKKDALVRIAKSSLPVAKKARLRELVHDFDKALRNVYTFIDVALKEAEKEER